MQNTQPPIKLKRDCDAIQIPSGYKFGLTAGTEVSITQTLGGNFTVLTDLGYLARIAGKDADALGLDVPPPTPALAQVAAQVTATGSAEAGTLDHAVWELLKTVYDPEIPVNIVDLGLVYLCKVSPIADGGNKVEVAMTMTAPGCGMGGALKFEAEEKIRTVPGVKDVDVQLVWDPPWDASRMTEAAKLTLGLM